MVGHEFVFYVTLKPEKIKDLRIRCDYREEFEFGGTLEVEEIRMVEGEILRVAGKFGVIDLGISMPELKTIIRNEVKKMNKLHVSARMKIREGKLEGFKKQAAEIIRQTKEKDTGTLQYDWFLSSDLTECEIREVYESSEALAEHKHNLRQALGRLFEEFAYDHNVVVYGDPSPQLLEGARKMMPDVGIKVYSFLQGLE